jgi:hypothetical protein
VGERQRFILSELARTESDLAGKWESFLGFSDYDHKPHTGEEAMSISSRAPVSVGVGLPKPELTPRQALEQVHIKPAGAPAEEATGAEEMEVGTSTLAAAVGAPTEEATGAEEMKVGNPTPAAAAAAATAPEEDKAEFTLVPPTEVSAETLQAQKEDELFEQYKLMLDAGPPPLGELMQAPTVVEAWKAAQEAEEKAKADAALEVTGVEQKATADATQMKATANVADAKATAEAAVAKATAKAAEATATAKAAAVTTDETKAAELTKATKVSQSLCVRVKETLCLVASLLILVFVWIIFSNHSEAPTTVEIVFHRASEAWTCVLQRRIDRMLGMERSSDVAGDGPESLNPVQFDHKDKSLLNPPPPSRWVKH